MPIDINRGSSGVVTLPKTVSNEIWTKTQNASIIQQLCRRIPLPAGGIDVPIITGDPVASWVNETDEKPVSRSTFGVKTIKGYKMAVIEPFSNEFRRDLPQLYGALVSRLPGVLAAKFDATALGFQATPGSGFDTLASAPAVSINTNAYSGFLAALSSVANVGGADVTGWALSTQGEIALLGALDTTGRPIFSTSVTEVGSVGSVLARPVYKAPSVYKAGVFTGSVASTVGFGGDWQSAVWGTVEDITIKVSDQASLNDGGTTINLWQRNMFAVMVEFEVGFAVRDANRFARLTGATPTS
jgi:HK97 family phage major capsid protein